jgi:hypothetical protein
MEVPWPGSEQATAHSVRASQWVVARLSLERRQERDAERRSKLYRLGMRAR